MVERGFRRGRKVAVAGADTNDQIGFASQEIRTGRTRHSYRSKGLRMVIGKCSLTGLSFADGNTGGRCKPGQGFRRFRVEHATTGDDQRVLRGANPVSGALQKFLITASP